LRAHLSYPSAPYHHISLFFNCPVGFNLYCPNASSQSIVKQALMDSDLVLNAFLTTLNPKQ
jgi:hypothetical protein